MGDPELMDAFHHDGSPLYLPEPPQEHGDPFTVLLRVPRSAGVRRVMVRQVRDGEPLAVTARVDRQAAHETWWRADLRAHNPVTSYRFLLDTPTCAPRWVTAAGTAAADPGDDTDFHVAAHPAPPGWVADAIAYQVFPDRFARSGLVDQPTPDWAIPVDWSKPPAAHGRATPRQLYGGDLHGVRQRLDHVASLGANLLYLTPVFPAQSNHRYNAATFDHVDPLLGGDVAYRELVDAAHARGMRIIGDLTTNHTGDTHEWFRRALADPDSVEAGFYFFSEDEPSGYVGWLGHPTLPKLDLRSDELRRRLVRGQDSVVGRWLRFGLDGWRVDVANMTGRLGPIDVNHDVAREMRATMAQASPDAWLVGEHFHDHRGDLDGSTWHGVMNYSGFSAPIWSWLVEPGNRFDWWQGVPVTAWPRLPGPAVVSAMRRYASVPWPARVASMSILSSHDTPRIRSITGDPALVEVAVAALVAHPGVPMVWAGDEIGLTGTNGEGGRRPFPWDEPATWDARTLAAHRELIALRRAHPALRRGGMRWVHVDADRLVWLRETREERVLVLVARASGPVTSIGADLLGLAEGAEAENLYGGARLRNAAGRAELPGDGPMAQLWRLPG